MNPYRIISMDGGGIRGVLTAQILSNIAAQRPAFLAKIDLLAGTSTGSILAIGLAMGLSPSALVSMYKENGKIIFENSIWHEVGGLWGVTGAKYTAENRLAGIHPIIGDGTLGELQKKVLVASFQLDSLQPAGSNRHTWKAKFFHNFEGEDSDASEKSIDVIMRSSAAPTFFPIYQGYIDGGVVANNPSMCALTQAIDPRSGKQDIKNIVLLSLGTGGKPEFITSQDGDWGLSQWGFKLLDLLFDSGSGLADYQCNQLLGPCYQRINPDLADPIGLDAIDKIETLIEAANNVELTPLLHWIDEQWLPDRA